MRLNTTYNLEHTIREKRIRDDIGEVRAEIGGNPLTVIHQMAVEEKRPTRRPIGG